LETSWAEDCLLVYQHPTTCHRLSSWRLHHRFLADAYGWPCADAMIFEDSLDLDIAHIRAVTSTVVMTFAKAWKDLHPPAKKSAPKTGGGKGGKGGGRRDDRPRSAASAAAGQGTPPTRRSNTPPRAPRRADAGKTKSKG
jgi:hypothetical protein